jgi:hypothetical protein
MPIIDPSQFGARPRPRRRVRTAGCLLAVIGTVIAIVFSSGNRSDPVAETEIFTGVWYGCRVLSATPEGKGPMHWARIDLIAPGVEPYVTPTDPALEGTGYQYRLKRVGTVARAEGLAVAVNGSLFTKEPVLVPGYWPGQRASGVETVVSDGRVSHVWEHTYLLWFDAARTPALERQKPPTADVRARAVWGIGGQGVGLMDGRVGESSGRDPDARTAIGIDSQRRLLFLAVFESASPRRALEELAALGARDGMLLDGGGSTAMVIGPGATGVRPGTVLGGWRPVATHFGVRASAKP